MTTLVLEAGPLAANVHITGNRLVVDLVDGGSLAVSLDWYPRLLHEAPGGWLRHRISFSQSPCIFSPAPQCL